MSQDGAEAAEQKGSSADAFLLCPAPCLSQSDLVRLTGCTLRK